MDPSVHTGCPPTKHVVNSPPDAPRDHEALIQTLDERGFLHSQRVIDALLATPRAPFLHEDAHPLAPVDVPAPLVDATREAAPCPSPRFTVTLLETLTLEPHHETLVQGPGVAWTAALIAQSTPQGHVTLHETDPALVSHAQRLLDEQPALEDATLIEGLHEAPDNLDRALLTHPTTPPDTLLDRLGEKSLLVHPVALDDGLDLVRAYNDGRGSASLRLSGTHVATQAEGLATPDIPSGVSVEQMLGTETLLQQAWTGTPQGVTAEEIHAATEETLGRALAENGHRATQPTRARTAQGAFHAAYVHQMTGEFSEALHAYTASSRIIETAEAYTFRGWTRSFTDDLDGAIQDCKNAIETDPAFGNPYNDIGAYLLEQDRPEDAIPWLQDAADADRYQAPEFPHLNLGRAHLRLGNHLEAKNALQRVLEIDPENEPAKRLLNRLDDGA